MSHLIQSALGKVIRQLPDGEGKTLLELSVAWQSASGPIISRTSRVIGLTRSGVLKIEIDSGQWLEPLKNSKSSILSRLAGFLGDRIRIADLDFEVTRKKPSGKSDHLRKPSPTRSTETIDPAVMNAIQDIPDPDIRDKFLKAYTDWVKPGSD